MKLPLFSLLTLALVASGADFDLLVQNARLIDGTGSPAMAGSIGIKGDRIVAIGEVHGSATTTLDAGGRVAAPGFIDVHTHSERIAKLSAAENFVRMGVTTIVTGNCGSSWLNVARAFGELKAAKVAINVATLVGHNSVRREAMGGNFLRDPSPAEMDHMKALVEKAMQDGAVGLSTGLIYVPGSFAKTSEILELAKVASAHGGIYASHMRSENVEIYDALDELMQIARGAHMRAELSHIKLSSPSTWGQAAKVLGILDRARAEGLEITHDMYAYTASSTGLEQLIPDKAREGTLDDFRKLLADPARKAALLDEMAQNRARQGRQDYSYVVIAKFDADPSLNGKTLPQAAKMVRGSDSLADQLALIFDIDLRGGGSGVYHGMSEEDLQLFLRHPLTMIASDGGPRVLGEDVPHPRSYGNNTRILGHYVRDLQILTLEEAVRRMTSLPAETFRLPGRGKLAPGAFADVVLFDPAKVNDPATFEDPHHYAEGIDDVIVNGVVTLRAGKLTGARGGGPLPFRPPNL